MSFILSILSLGAAGLFLTLLVVGWHRRSYPVAELFSLSFFLGAGFAAYQCLVFYLLGVNYSLMNMIMLPVVLFVLAFSRYAARPERMGELAARGGEKKKWNAAEKLLVAGIMVQVLWTVLLAFPVPVHSHDAVANYALKAKIFYFSGGVPQGFFGWGEATVAHPDYPPLLPFLMTWIYAFTGFNDLVVKMVMPAAYTAFLCLFYCLAGRFFTRAYSLLVVFLLATVPQLADYATIIHADLFLAAYVTLGLAYFLVYAREGDRVSLVFSSLFFGVALWVKNEAIVFAGAFAAVLVICLFGQYARRGKKVIADAVCAFLILAAVAAPWFVVKALQGAPNSDMDLSSITVQRVLQNVRDIPVILNLFQQEVFGPKKWNIFWVAFFAAMIWKRKRLFKDENFYIMVFLLLSAAGYFAGYMLTTGENLYFYVNTTISRFMLHFCGIAMLLTAFLLWDEVRGIGSFRVGRTPAPRAGSKDEMTEDKYVFLDRDGVINRDGEGRTEYGYITRWEDFRFVPGVLEALAKLKENGYKCVVISNQKCVGKGLMSEEALADITDRFTKAVAEHGGSIEKAYYCLHVDEDDCDCRKPKPGLLLRARDELGIKTLNGKFFIGDSERDMRAGKAAGMGTIFVLTGKYGREDALKWECRPDHVCEDLGEAVELIIKEKG